MNLKLKHLAPYLPYGLIYKRKKGGMEFELSPVNITHVLNSPGSVDILLRPLSDLTKEIEYNGEKFVPFIIIFENNIYVNTADVRAKAIGYVLDGETNWITQYNGTLNPNCGYWIVEKLFEWHFDVFNLIEKGLAIKKIKND